MGIGFAIPVNTARQVLEGIVKEGGVRRGWIGVEPADLSPELMETFGVKAKSGVLITGVLQNGPAAQAGIRPGDVIVDVGDKPVANTSELMTKVAALKPGVPAKFRVQRRDENVELTVTPALRQSQRARQQR
jgi:S1-C subfamily serine protease